MIVGRKATATGKWAQPVHVPRLRTVDHQLREVTRQELQYLRGRCSSGAPNDPGEQAAITVVIENDVLANLRPDVKPESLSVLDQVAIHDLRTTIAERCRGDRAHTA